MIAEHADLIAILEQQNWIQVEADLTDEQLVASVNDSVEIAEAIEEDDSHYVEEIIIAPSLSVMRQQLKRFAAFMADNPQFTAEDEMTLQVFVDKVAKMVISRINNRKQQQQQSIGSCFSIQ